MPDFPVDPRLLQMAALTGVSNPYALPPQDTFRFAHGTENIPGAGLHPLLPFLLGPLAQNLSDVYGIQLLGLTRQNAYDRLRQLEITRLYQQIISDMSQRDREGYLRLARGTAALLGIPWGPEQQAGARVLADWGVWLTPLLSQMAPTFLDQIMGQRGSMAVMAQGVFRGGRFRMDPVTGRYFLSQDSLRELVTRLDEELYAGRERPLLSAGDLGATFAELQRRGLIRGLPREISQTPLFTREPAGPLLEAMRTVIAEALRQQPDRADLRALLTPAGRRQAQFPVGQPIPLRQDISLEEFRRAFQAPDLAEALSRMDVVATRLRAFDSQRAVESLREYQRVIRALRDIFGDAGQADAPVPELLNMLQRLSGNALVSISGIDTARLVRTTYNLAREAGVPLGQLGVITQQAQAQAVQMGLEPILGTTAAQHGLAAMQAYQRMGLGAAPAWGAPDMAQFARTEQQRMLNAARSPMANQMAVALRMAEAIGGFERGSWAEAYVQAVRARRTEFEYQGRTYQIHQISDSEFTQRMAESSAGRLSRAMVTQQIWAFPANQEVIFRNDLGEIAWRAQNRELSDLLRVYAQRTVSQSALLQGVPQAQRQRLETELSGAAVEALRTLTPEQQADPRLRDQHIARALEARLRTIQARGGAEGAAAQQILNREELRGQLGATAAVLWGTLDRISQETLRSSLVGVLRSTSPETERQIETARLEARYAAGLQEALAPLGMDSVLRRATEAIFRADIKDKDAAIKVFIQSLGGVPKAEVFGAQARTQIENIFSARAEYERAFEAFRKETDPGRREIRRQEFIRAADALQTASQALAGRAEQFGLYAPEGITRETVRTLRRQQDLVTQALKTAPPENPQEFGQKVEQALTQTERLTGELLRDERTMLRLGAPARQHLGTILSNLHELQTAAERAGMTPTELLGATREALQTRKVDVRLQERARTAYAQMTGATETLAQNIEGGWNFPWLPISQEELQRLVERLNAKGYNYSPSTLTFSVSEERLRAWDLAEEDKNLLRQILQARQKEEGAVYDLREEPKRTLRKALHRVGTAIGLSPQSIQAETEVLLRDEKSLQRDAEGRARRASWEALAEQLETSEAVLRRLERSGNARQQRVAQAFREYHVTRTRRVAEAKEQGFITDEEAQALRARIETEKAFDIGTVEPIGLLGTAKTLQALRQPERRSLPPEGPTPTQRPVPTAPVEDDAQLRKAPKTALAGLPEAAEERILAVPVHFREPSDGRAPRAAAGPEGAPQGAPRDREVLEIRIARLEIDPSGVWRIMPIG